MRRLIPESISVVSLYHQTFFRLTIFIALCLFVAAINPASSNAQGFGILKIKGALQYKEPPLVYLPGNTFIVEAFTQTSVSDKVLDQLKTGIENGLALSDRRLKLAATNPETWISCTITEVETSSGWENKTRSEYQAIGSHTDGDQTVTDYGYVDVHYRALVVKGRMTIIYEARDTSSNLVVDSETLPITFSRDFENGIGAFDDEAARQQLASNAASAVASRLIPRKEWVSVLLPKGKLKQSSNLFKDGLWNQSLDMLEAMPPFKNPKDDAYRHYSLGVAYEAIAFTLNDLAGITAYLEKAADSYKRATELKPKENGFWESRHRVERALSQYRRVAEQLSAFEARKKNPVSGQSKPQPPAQAVRTSANILTNNEVINWVKSGIAEDYIIASIKHAPSSNFDLSPSEVDRMKRAGVSNRIINAMRDWQRPRRPGLSARRLFTTLLSLWPYWVVIF